MSRLELDIQADRPEFSLSIDLSLPLEGLTAIFGPSGAGKTTLLRAIAGLERPRGRIVCGDTVWQDARRFVPPHRRRVATVFQDSRLFAHLSVAGNLAYAARRAGRMDALAATAERFGLGALLHRRTAALSGGEAQRVALARALLTAPRLILMDEPLSALDHARRQDILPHIEALRDEARIPILYVSHSVTEVSRLATRVLAIAGGRWLGFGPAAEVLADAGAEAAFGDSEPGSLIVARVLAHTEDGLTELAFDGGRLLCPGRLSAPGATLRLFVQARDVLLSRARPEGLSALNILPARVQGVTPCGEGAAEAMLLCGQTPLRARLTARSAAALDLAPGAQVHAILKTVALARD